MNKNTRSIITIVALSAFAGLLLYSYRTEVTTKNQFLGQNEKVAQFAETTGDRVASSVITIPDENIVVGMDTYVGHYVPKGIPKISTVSLTSALLRTHFIEGKYKAVEARLDVAIPMVVSLDPQGGSTYIVLFNDRGDAVIEQSYARLGGSNVEVKEISFEAPSKERYREEYRVKAEYARGGSPHTIIIPVVDGRFDPKNTVSD